MECLGILIYKKQTEPGNENEKMHSDVEEGNHKSDISESHMERF